MNGTDFSTAAARRDAKPDCREEDVTDTVTARHLQTLKLAKEFLRQSYLVLGMWGSFSLFIVCIVAYMGYQLFKAVLEYYQLRSSVAGVKGDALDVASDDNEVYESYNKLERPPSGNEIMNRLKRYGKSNPRLKDIRDSLDSDKDRYVNRAAKGDDDEYDR